MNTKHRSLALLVSGLILSLCGGCAADGARPAAAYERKNRRTTAALLAAGDADSLAAAALLGGWPRIDSAERLALIARAVAAAPDRPDLIWLSIRACIHVETCDPTPLAAQLRVLDPGNGAAEWVSLGRAAKANDASAVRKYLAAMANSTRFDIYWNVTVVHATNAVLKTKTLDLKTAFLATLGADAGLAIPPYQSITNTCKERPLDNPDIIKNCRQVAAVMRRGDTYITEMVGLAIAKRAWPEDSAEYSEATSATRVARYRIQTDGQIGLHHLWSAQYAKARLQLMTDHKTEQEVGLADITNAKLSPDPPSGWTDEWAAL